MTFNFLLLNSNKTELIVLGPKNIFLKTLNMVSNKILTLLSAVMPPNIVMPVDLTING